MVLARYPGVAVNKTYHPNVDTWQAELCTEFAGGECLTESHYFDSLEEWPAIVDGFLLRAEELYYSIDMGYE
jgi:hypothetical protein